MTIQCCKCKKVNEQGQWVHAVGHHALVSHTYCPVCYQLAIDEFIAELPSLSRHLTATSVRS